MGTQEAVPAKLDLARAYLAMEDYRSAHHVLVQVINLGNLSQRQEAESLMKQIPSSDAAPAHS